MKKVIFFVDDDKLANLISRKNLEKVHPKAVIYQFYSGWEAIDYLSVIETSEMQKIVIFLDINMPGMNGWEFLEELKKEYAHLPVVVHILSSSVDPEDQGRADTYDMVRSFISKPLTKEKIHGFKVY